MFKCMFFQNGGLSGTNLTLWGFLENPRTFEIQSGQEKRALEGSFSKNGGRYKARTCAPLNVVQVRYPSP